MAHSLPRHERCGLSDVHLDLDADATNSFCGLPVQVDVHHLSGSLSAGYGQPDLVGQLGKRLCVGLDAGVGQADVVEVFGVAQRGR